MTVASHTANTYLRTRVMTASREELRLLLLEGAIKFASQARDGLLQKNYESVFSGTDSARNIIVELITTIREEPDPELAAKVRALYTFFYIRLTEASFEKDVEKFNEVINLLEYERETWVMLMEKLASDRASESALETADEFGAGSGDRGPISFEG